MMVDCYCCFFRNVHIRYIQIYGSERKLQTSLMFTDLWFSLSYRACSNDQFLGGFFKNFINFEEKEEDKNGHATEAHTKECSTAVTVVDIHVYSFWPEN